jgi:hypothetical protein
MPMVFRAKSAMGKVKEGWRYVCGNQAADCI